MPAMRWVGFGLIWLALVLFTAESLRHRQRRRRQLRGDPVEVASPAP
jgi:chloramphenicol-sensitive protein RarD